MMENKNINDHIVCEVETLKKELKSNLEVLLSNNMLMEARAAIAKYEEIDKLDAEMYSLKAIIEIHENNLETAIMILLEGYTLDRNNFDLLYNLGFVYILLKNNEEARFYLLKALNSTDNRESQELVQALLIKTDENQRFSEQYKSQEVLKKKIFIICPGGLATGGPELLHQLCFKLNKLGYDAYMYYYGGKENPVHERYKGYGNRYVHEIYNTENNTFIMPEVVACTIKNLNLNNIIIWWLSVDNFLESLKINAFSENDIFNAIKKRVKSNRIIHFAQSQYAIDYLCNSGIDKKEIYYLSDYLSDDFIKQPLNDKIDESRYPNVLYNPNKGYQFTSKIIKASPELNWIPLVNYTPEEMRIVMNRSMVYIDFGNHPGKDRIPREAVVCGLCILVGCRGAASNKIDIPIPEEYKIRDDEENIQLIIGKIKKMISNYKEERMVFNEYKNIILQEESKFECDIKHIMEVL